MEKITKKRVLSAVDELIKSYRSHEDTHDMRSCPLCQIYCPGRRSHECNDNNCLNSPFHSIYRDRLFGCLSRISFSRSLDWDQPDHRLIEYWTKVREMLGKEKSSDIIQLTNSIPQKILKIANELK